MKKYLLFICLSIFLLTCESDNNNSVNPVDNEDDTVDTGDLVEVDVWFPYPGRHSLSIGFNDKSYFFIYYYDLFHGAPIEYINHFITYLKRGEHTVTVSKLNFRDFPDSSSITYSQNFTLGDAEKYRLRFDFEDEFEVIISSP